MHAESSFFTTAASELISTVGGSTLGIHPHLHVGDLLTLPQRFRQARQEVKRYRGWTFGESSQRHVIVLLHFLSPLVVL